MSVVPSLLFGREEEFSFLMHHFESVKKGQGTVILIGGEAGIGKTSLVELLASRVEREGGLVVRGYCLSGIPIPYFPFAEALSKLLGNPVQASPMQSSSDTPVRLTTGNQDLDWLLDGGLPEGYAVALAAPSCDEKGLLIKGFLGSGAKRGEVTFSVTIDSSVAKPLVREYLSSFHLFLCNPQADALVENAANICKLRGVENLTDISIALTSAMRELDPARKTPRRICIDLVSDVLLQHGAVQTRKWLTALIAELKSKGFTVLAVLDPQMHPPEELHAILGLFDGEISIYEKETKKGHGKYLQIKKMSNYRYLNSEVLLKNLENELLLKKEGVLNWLVDRETGHKPSVLQKDEMFELVLEKLEEVSCKRPLLLFLDDLHYADSASLVLLHYLARNIRNSMVMIIGTYRSEELVELAPGNPNPLLETMRMMSREALYHKLELGGLRAESVKELAATIIRGASDQVLELVAEESEGNPFYAVESARFLIGSDAIEKEGNKWRVKDPHVQLEMPTTIQDLIARRLSRLDRVETQLIECASVVGEHFVPEVIARTLNLDELSVTQKLAGMGKERKLVVEDQEGYRFEHARIRDVVYDGLGRNLAKTLHHYVAETLLELKGVGSIHQLAYHYHAAGVKDKIIKFSLMAGDQAKQQFAYSEAAAYYGWVVEAAGEDPENFESEAEALAGRAESFHFQGLNQQAISDSEEALRISKDGSIRLRALRWCGESLFSMGHLNEAMECVTRAKDEPGEESAERLGLRRIEALFLGYKGDQQASLDILREVATSYLKLGMRGEYADCLLEMGAMYLSKLDVQSAVEATKEAEGIYGESNTGGWCYYVYQRLASIYFATGDYVEASRNYGKSVDLCLKFGLFEDLIWNESYWGQLNDAAGKYDEALSHLMKALEAAELAEAAYPETGTYATLVRVYLHLNKVDEAERAFVRMNELYDKHSKDASLGLQGLVARARAFRMATKGLWMEADRDYSKSIELLHKGPLSAVHETETRLEYAEWLLKQNRNDEAEDQIRAATSIFEKVGNRLGVDKVQQILKRIPEH